MAAAGVVALKLVINLRRRIQFFFQTVSADQRRRTVHFIETADLLRNFEKSCIVVQFLQNQFLTENACQVFCLHRLEGARMQKRRRLMLHISAQIVPCCRHFILIQIDFVRNFFVFHRHFLLFSPFSTSIPEIRQH